MSDKKKVLVTGSRGMLAYALLPALDASGYDAVGIDVQEADITDQKAIFTEISRIRPDFIVHTAAMTAVDACEDYPEKAMSINGVGAGNVAAAAAEIGAPIIHISTDYVFNGAGTAPYTEDAPIEPISEYGKSKAMGEKAVAEANYRHFIVRTAWLYGQNGKNFVDTIIKLAREREELKVVSDQVGSPTYTAHLARALVSLVDTCYYDNEKNRYGIYHATNSGNCSWHGFATAILARVQHGVKRIVPIDSRQIFEMMNYKAPRPAYSVLSNKKLQETYGVFLPSWEEGLDDYLNSLGRGS